MLTDCQECGWTSSIFISRKSDKPNLKYSLIHQSRWIEQIIEDEVI